MVKIHYDYTANYGGDKYSLVSELTVIELNRVLSKYSNLDNLNIVIVNNEKLKVPMKVSKVNDVFRFITGHEILLEVNDTFLNLFEESIDIIIEQEFSKVYVDIENGKIKIDKPTLITNSELVKKYGSKDVIKINEVIKIVADNLDDYKHNPSVVSDMLNNEMEYLEDSIGKNIKDGNWA